MMKIKASHLKQVKINREYIINKEGKDRRNTSVRKVMKAGISNKTNRQAAKRRL